MRAMSNMLESNGGDMSAIPGMDMEDTDKITNMMNMIKYGNILLISGVINSLICLIGALQMWKQKKIGFFIYTVGEIVPLVVSAICLGASGFAKWGIIGIIIPVVFITLYAVNLKHMN